MCQKGAARKKRIKVLLDAMFVSSTRGYGVPREGTRKCAARSTQLLESEQKVEPAQRRRQTALVAWAVGSATLICCTTVRMHNCTYTQLYVAQVARRAFRFQQQRCERQPDHEAERKAGSCIAHNASSSRLSIIQPALDQTSSAYRILPKAQHSSSCLKHSWFSCLRSHECRLCAEVEVRYIALPGSCSLIRMLKSI